ncbi:MAG: PQQ-binding-like beta-propeller repeat protein [Prevotellaceae bacterium]|jgi:outer membrane protein assembly factor BamB|nr:PQQ-binding-like beta-propeller repeat protein [Prevotellaceae bacterium]
MKKTKCDSGFLVLIQISLSSIVCFFLFATAQAQENAQWRGASRDGYYNESGLLKQWPEEGPEMFWNYNGLGEGYTSVSVADDKIYVTGMIDSIGYLYILNTKGELLKKKAYGPEWNVNYNGSRSTVCVNGKKLYIFSGRGVLYALDAENLHTLWTKDIQKDFDGHNLTFGMAESPLIVGEALYLTPGGEKFNMVSLNKHTGELLWSSTGIGKPSTYCSPQYIGDLKIPVVVTAIDSNLVAFNAEMGDMLWKVDQKNPYGHSPNTPIYEKNLLFSVSGGGVGAVQYRLNPDGTIAEKVWTNEMDSKHGAAVKVGDYVYGSGEKNRYWYCIDWRTGKTMYKDNSIGVGNIIAADGMLYCYSDRGELALVEATPEKFNIKGKIKITLGTNQHWAHPVIYKGMLYLRHGDALMAYKIQ